MKHASFSSLVILSIFLSTAACSVPDNASAGEPSASAPTFCSCVNAPVPTQMAACGRLMDGMSPEEVTERTIACRADLAVPANGPDLCFCLKTFTQDPQLAEACQAILPMDADPMTLARLISDCQSG